MESLDVIYFNNPLSSYIAFASIIVLGYVLRSLISKILSNILYRVLGKFGEGVSVEHFVEMLTIPIRSFITHILIYIAINQIHYPLYEKLFKVKGFEVTAHFIIEHIFLLLLVLDVFRILFRLVDFITEVFEYRASLTESMDDDQLVPFVREIARIVLYIIQVFIILGVVLEVNVGALTAGVGIGGLAIALAAKDSLANLLGSFTIFTDKPFVVGDFVKVNGIEGTIEKVGFRSTRIRTPDKSLITIPNYQIVDNALDNLTTRSSRRLNFTIGLDCDTPSEKLKAIIKELKIFIDTKEDIAGESTVSFEGFGQFSLNIEVICFTKMIDYTNYSRIREEINFGIVEIVQKNKAEITIPVQKVITTTTK